MTQCREVRPDEADVFAPNSKPPQVITHEASHTKKIIFHPRMMPKVTICDPELTVGMPPIITAGTGMDAFSHCLEAYCGPFYHPLHLLLIPAWAGLVATWRPMRRHCG